MKHLSLLLSLFVSLAAFTQGSKPATMMIPDDIKVEFAYVYDADYDRFIRLNNGWKINLGRGLDLFDKVDRFSIDRISQEDRRCKACSIAFVREEDER